jgi:hypothetical protein
MSVQEIDGVLWLGTLFGRASGGRRRQWGRKRRGCKPPNARSRLAQAGPLGVRPVILVISVTPRRSHRTGGGVVSLHNRWRRDPPGSNALPWRIDVCNYAVKI